jgi:hypothetical protein
VNFLLYSAKKGVRESTKYSLRITWPSPIASAPSVPGAGLTHSSANLTFSA